VSERHANFIVNSGGARAADVLALVEEVRAEVRARSGQDLVLEVEVWGGGQQPAPSVTATASQAPGIRPSEPSAAPSAGRNPTNRSAVE
jgi:hypothetical protein